MFASVSLSSPIPLLRLPFVVMPVCLHDRAVVSDSDWLQHRAVCVPCANLDAPAPAPAAPPSPQPQTADDDQMATFQLVGAWFQHAPVECDPAEYPGCLKIINWGARVFLIEAGQLIHARTKELIAEALTIINPSPGTMVTCCLVLEPNAQRTLLKLERCIISLSGTHNGEPADALYEARVRSLAEASDLRSSRKLQRVDLAPLASARGVRALELTDAREFNGNEKQEGLLRMILYLSDTLSLSKDPVPAEFVAIAELLTPLFLRCSGFACPPSVLTVVIGAIRSVYLDPVVRQASKAMSTGAPSSPMLFDIHGLAVLLTPRMSFKGQPKTNRMLKAMRQACDEVIARFPTELQARMHRAREAYEFLLVRWWQISPPLLHSIVSLASVCAEDHMWEHLGQHPELLQPANRVSVFFSIRGRHQRIVHDPCCGAITPPCNRCHVHLDAHLRHVYARAGIQLTEWSRHMEGTCLLQYGLASHPSPCAVLVRYRNPIWANVSIGEKMRDVFRLASVTNEPRKEIMIAFVDGPPTYPSRLEEFVDARRSPRLIGIAPDESTHAMWDDTWQCRCTDLLTFESALSGEVFPLALTRAANSAIMLLQRNVVHLERPAADVDADSASESRSEDEESEDEVESGEDEDEEDEEDEDNEEEDEADNEHEDV